VVTSRDRARAFVVGKFKRCLELRRTLAAYARTLHIHKRRRGKAAGDLRECGFNTTRVSLRAARRSELESNSTVEAPAQHMDPSRGTHNSDNAVQCYRLLHSFVDKSLFYVCSARKICQLMDSFWLPDLSGVGGN
jgi:hypothetical protein